MQIYIGADHGGFELKERIKEWLTEWGYTWEDLGNTIYDKDDDYPAFAFAVGKKVGEEKESMGILACRSAGGVVIAANKVKGAWAVNAHDVKAAVHAREHNNANIVALSGDWLTDDEAKKILKTFLDTKFTGEERHVRRLKAIEEYEQK